jgi:uncharacterized membrane protein
MNTDHNPLERAVLRAFPWLTIGLVAAIPLLAIPASTDRRWDLLIHLSALVLFSLALTWRLGPATPEGWFAGRQWARLLRFVVAVAALVIVVTGVAGLVTLASSAALRFEPSLQFLQLLSALDIAWVVAGTTLATEYLWGKRVAIVAGLTMSIVCVTSIALYLAEVGLDPNGGWLVDAEQMLRLVLPFDVIAAVMTVALVVVAARRSVDRTGQTPVV